MKDNFFKYFFAVQCVLANMCLFFLIGECVQLNNNFNETKAMLEELNAREDNLNLQLIAENSVSKITKYAVGCLIVISVLSVTVILLNSANNALYADPAACEQLYNGIIEKMRDSSNRSHNLIADVTKTTIDDNKINTQLIITTINSLKACLPTSISRKFPSINFAEQNS